MVLQTIRERLTGILAFFILGILVIPFAFVGINSYFTSGSENIVARVNDVDITLNDFNQSYTTYRRRMQAIMGAAFDPEAFDTLVARREHLDRLIDEEVIRQAAQAMQLEVDDDRLAEQIRSIPAFQVEGQFNHDVYQTRLTAQGLTAQQFENDMRRQVVMNQLPAAIFGSSISTALEVGNYVALEQQTRTFATVLFPADVDAVEVAFTDAEIEAWYQDHPQDFQSQEQVAVDYLELNAQDMFTGVEPDDAFLQERFEQQKGRFVSPEQRLAAHILIAVAPDADEAAKETARQRADDLAKRARAGEDFAALAAENSEDLGSKGQGGDLGWVEPGLMTESFEEALYQLSLEAPISEPVQTGFGWHVIELRDIRPASGMSFEEARPVLVQEYEEEQAEREYLEKADRLVDLIYEDPTTLEPAALELGLELRSAGPFARSGGEGIAANPQFVQAAFSDLVLLQNSVSDPVDLGENHMVMLHLREHLPAAVRPLDEVRDTILAELRQLRATETARSAAAAFLVELQEAGAELDTVAENAGREVLRSDGVTRRSAVPDAAVVAAAFRLDTPDGDEPRRAVVESADGFAVVVLNDVVPGALDENAFLARQQVQRQVGNAAASAEAVGLLRQLRGAAKVEVFENRLITG